MLAINNIKAMMLATKDEALREQLAMRGIDALKKFFKGKWVDVQDQKPVIDTKDVDYPYGDRNCPHCGTKMYRWENGKKKVFYKYVDGVAVYRPMYKYQCKYKCQKQSSIRR
jgi:hypothetical protein